MKFLTSNILDSTPSEKANLQTAFDLLGELIKNNAQNLAILEGMFTPLTCRRFTDAVLRNLVDSNVFLRSLYLTMSLSDAAQQPTASMAGYCLHSWRQFTPVRLVAGPGTGTKADDDVASLFSEQLRLDDVRSRPMSADTTSEGSEETPSVRAYFEEMRDTVLVKLLCAVTVRTINHENICCVNSALIILLQDYVRL